MAKSPRLGMGDILLVCLVLGSIVAMFVVRILRITDGIDDDLGLILIVALGIGVLILSCLMRDEK